MIQPTTNGDIIKSSYQIIIRASFGSNILFLYLFLVSCCNQSECLELPI